MGVVTYIVLATVEGREGEKGKEEVENIGSIIVESLLLMDHSREPDNLVPFKVCYLFPI